MSTEDLSSWRELLTAELTKQGESMTDILQCTLSDEELDALFYAGYGPVEGKPFTAWTERRVYFPAWHDGSEWVDSVPRHPCDEAKRHVNPYDDQLWEGVNGVD
ncbi:hypothetical protein [Chitinilyticum litopenaei]|uniref:hypothetical protein n=1 Tax=Chitinilyticum litopenaei TaxID=1121276 RepID=UPI0006890217|nr:hypothetical protein [Chitinilyticum litopenaei]